MVANIGKTQKGKKISTENTFPCMHLQISHILPSVGQEFPCCMSGTITSRDWTSRLVEWKNISID